MKISLLESINNNEFLNININIRYRILELLVFTIDKR